MSKAKQTKGRYVCPYCFDTSLERPNAKKGNRGNQAEAGAFCPRCGAEIQPEFLDSEVFPIVVVGASRAGKTHYLTMLAHLLCERVLWSNYWSVTRMIRRVAKSSGRGVSNQDAFVEFEDTLFPQGGARELLGGTQQHTAQDIARPLVIHFHYEESAVNWLKEPWRRGRPKDFLLSITDTAGESLTRKAWDDMLAKYPVLDGWAKGIVACLDPSELRNCSEEMDPQSGRRRNEYADAGIDDSVLTTVESVLSIQEIRGKMKKIPLAVCLMKTDALRALGKLDGRDILVSPMGAEGPQRGKPMDQGVLNLGDILKVSKRTEEFITASDGGDKVANAASHFTYRQFFAVDALGGALQGGRLVSEPEPRRVLDPVLWILWQYGYVGGRKA